MVLKEVDNYLREMFFLAVIRAERPGDAVHNHDTNVKDRLKKE